MTGIDPTLLALATIALILGGMAKGTLGIGLPIIVIAILSNFLPVVTVLAIVSLPILATNFWQAVHSGNLMRPLKRFWLLILFLMTGIWLGAKIVVSLAPETLYAVLGVVVVLFTLTVYFKPPRTLPARLEKWVSPVAGLTGGLLGGISTVWGPPMIMYFVMLRLDKDEFVRTVGLVWFTAAVPMVIAYAGNGILTKDLAVVSLIACVPGFIGVAIGQAIRNRINQETFRKALLIILFIIGLNLIRRAFF
ncbi:MAG: sulfite exporter TauE/SafE family protein [Rhodospirillales bacterium]|nr:sulfite exporter TauE/SafE family protein [Rhodospirillales bacterium]